MSFGKSKSDVLCERYILEIVDLTGTCMRNKKIRFLTDKNSILHSARKYAIYFNSCSKYTLQAEFIFGKTTQFG